MSRWEDFRGRPRHGRGQRDDRKDDRGGMQADPAKVKGDVIHYLEARFGMPPSLVEGYSLYLGPKNRVYLGPSAVPPGLKIVSPGLLIARADSGIKPSTNLFQLFGAHVTRNILILSKGQAVAFVRGEDLSLKGKENETVSDGYVLARYIDYNLGCGLLKNGMLKNTVPKAKRLELKLM